MIVTVCKPTDEIVGTFEIEGLEELRPHFLTFAARHAVSADDLAKCGDRCIFWRIGRLAALCAGGVALRAE